jgi:formylglycine-generating enzyme required for sulfatase activity
VIHRDISPANIMLDREGNAILMDFGISKFILSESGVGSTSVTQTGQVIGTPLYMSPEQIEDSSRVGLQTDIYSLGVVLWQSVTGKVPYGADGMSQYNLIKRVVEQPLEKTHTKWDVLIEKATQKEPSNRFSSAQAFKAALGNKRPDGGQKEPKSVVDRDNNNNNKWGGKALVIIVCLLIVPIVYLVINNTKTTIEADQISKSYSKGGSRSNASSHSAKNLMGNFILVKGGNFKMGCTSALSDCDGDEKPVRMVTLSDYYMGETEVTVRQFKQFVDETGYTTDAENDGGSYFWTGSRWEKRFGVDWRFDAVGQRRPTSAYDHPVVHVSWNDATAFARWMTAGASGQYRLPTEAEWEYAARGGSLSRGYQFAGSNNLDEVAWYASNSGGNTRTVKGKKPNELGLYDMSGNVWEFCSDWYSTYPFDNQTNPTGPFSDSRRVDRGGSCFNEPNDCRVSNRSNGKVGFRGYRLGFRLAWTP